MKYNVIFQLVFLTFYLNAIGQVADTLPQHKIYKLPKSEGSLDFSLRFPVGAFSEDFKANPESESGGVVESIEGTDGGMDAAMGYEFGVTGNFFFDKKPSNINTGLRITYFSFSSIPFRWKAQGDYIFNTAEFSNLNFVAIKTGIVIRIALAEKKSFLIYDQPCLTYGWNGGMTYSYNYNGVSDEAEMQLHDGIGIRNEGGVSFRTGHFVANFGFSFGKINFNKGLFTRNISANGYTPINIDMELKTSMPTSTFFLSVGVGF